MLRARSILLLAILSSLVFSGTTLASPVDVYVKSDRGYWLPSYEVSPRGAERRITFRSYVEAVYGDRYSVYVRNNTPFRVGIVVAVDGRNIITGKKSNLSSSERMYLLDPYGTGSYEGWRTGSNKVNRFYFTDPGESYSAAFGDYSAMGVIAVVAYREVPPPPPPPPLEPPGIDWDRQGRGDIKMYGYEGRRSGEDAPLSPGVGAKERSVPAPQAKTRNFGAAEAPAKDSLGTGFGEERYSPVVTVEFRPEPRPISRHLLKYETRNSLCRKGIVDCRPRGNRLWDDDYATPPPGK